MTKNFVVCGTMGCSRPNMHPGLCNCIMSEKLRLQRIKKPQNKYLVHSSPHPSEMLLSSTNGRFVGTLIKSKWQKNVYYQGTIVSLCKFPYLKVKYDDENCYRIIDPRILKSYIVYRAPRVGSMYQMSSQDIPSPDSANVATDRSTLISDPFEMN